ncbi:alpha/beta fold hydrolase [Streptomyces sp. 8N616]|uniref:alpha/beta fold hydrolase n=1 Tax=Streptomyces sp. 8N616 TaxID=3457414 RepID=UPI003FD02504
MKIRRLPLRAVALSTAGAGMSLAMLLTPLASAEPIDSASPHEEPVKPTIVLVHDAFADGSSWGAVIKQLQSWGYTVKAPANPLRGLQSDATYLADFLESIEGPIVLAGHSYGGEVITQAAANDPDVKALVYIAGLAPEKGESASELFARKIPNPLPPLPLLQVPFTAADGTKGIDAYLDPAKFHERFAADVPEDITNVMAAVQRPISAAAFMEEAQAAAWKKIPSWYLVAKQDQTIAPDLERFMAKRAGSETVEIDSSHVPMISHPEDVSRLIEKAADATEAKPDAEGAEAKQNNDSAEAKPDAEGTEAKQDGDAAEAKPDAEGAEAKPDTEAQQ